MGQVCFKNKRDSNSNNSCKNRKKIMQAKNSKKAMSKLFKIK